MNLHAESSAVLAWLFDKPTAPTIRTALASADLVLISELTLVECQRALIPLASLDQSTEAESADNYSLSHMTLHFFCYPIVS